MPQAKGGKFRLKARLTGVDALIERGVERYIGLQVRMIEKDFVAHHGEIEAFARERRPVVLEGRSQRDAVLEPQE